MSKPDILIFLSDQHHTRYAGFSGHPLVRTPNLDRLAQDGTVFDAAYTACPLCVPARTAFLTGQLPSVTGVFSNDGAIGEDQATFIHSLGAEGYETVLCGRMHFKGDDQRHGFTKRIMGEITPLFWGVGGADRTDLGPFVGTLSEARCLEVIGGGNSPVLEYDRAVIRAALDYLRQDHEKPQCIVVGTYAPHFTYVAPPELFSYYRERVSAPEHNERDKNYQHPLMEKRNKRGSQVPFEVMLDARAAYFGMIENLDAQIGEVRQEWDAYLKRQQRQGLFFYLSDHGDQAGEHHMYGKQTFFEGSAGIPLLVAGDGVPSGRRMSGAVSMIDIGPTLCEIAGGMLPPKQGGQSLTRQIFEGADDPDRAVISEYLLKDEQRRSIPGRMLRQGNWKLISYDLYEEYDLLFDLQEDPWETTNVRDRYPEQYAELKRKLSAGWDVSGIREVDAEKQQHYRILNNWGKSVQAEETERWPIPGFARILPEK